MKIKVNKCNLFYERWSIQCCSEPIHKNTHVELSAEYHHPRTLGDRIYIDFDENHHDCVDYSLKGDVCSISAVFVDATKYGSTIDEDTKYKLVDIDSFSGFEKIDAYAQFGGQPCGYLLEMKDAEISLVGKAEDTFSIKIEELFAGWEHIVLIFNGIQIPFRASYIGREPLSTLIEAVELLDERNSTANKINQFKLEWEDEPGYMKIEFRHDLSNGRLLIDIEQSEPFDPEDDSEEEFPRRWNIEMEYSLFRKAVVQAICVALRKYGFSGFIRSWDSFSNSFPIGTLLRVLGMESGYNSEGLTYKTDLKEEISILNKILPTQEKNVKEETAEVSDDEFFKVLSQESDNNLMAIEKLCKHFNVICREVEDGKWGIGLSLDGAFLLINPLHLVNSIYQDRCNLYISGANNTGTFKVECIRQEFCYEWILSHTQLEVAGRCYYTYKEYQSKISSAVNTLCFKVQEGAETIYDSNIVNKTNLELCHRQLAAKWVLPSSDRSVGKPKSSEITVEEFEFLPEDDMEKYHVGIGNRGFEYYITDWDNDYDSIRHELEHYCYGYDTTIHLNCDTIDWWIKLEHKSILKSVEESYGGLKFDYDYLCLVSVNARETGLSPILTGYCNKKQIIRSLYEGMLLMALRHPTQADTLFDSSSLQMYNKIKSPIIESWLSKANVSSHEPIRRQTDIDAVWIIEPDYDTCIVEIAEDKISFDVENDTFNNNVSYIGKPFTIPGFSSWSQKIRNVVIASGTGEEYEFDWEDYHKRGLELARELRAKMPYYIDLWYRAPFEDKSGILPRPVLIM